ncbi:hypothetical protein NQ317_010397 [Molorchus minor]|uniref:Beta-ketoacyl synthase-like N-terminal domain-containing protein n=1 Tax=Molorchus minor TaxID=1323400 RepID=A0ABQ9ISI9_9CUCU|nr:hypothetical protein NQ317_010397 [Molorchus minor]
MIRSKINDSPQSQLFPETERSLLYSRLGLQQLLYAVEHAFRSIRMGEVDVAIVGGVHLCLLPFVALQFARSVRFIFIVSPFHRKFAEALDLFSCLSLPKIAEALVFFLVSPFIENPGSTIPLYEKTK